MHLYSEERGQHNSTTTSIDKKKTTDTEEFETTEKNATPEKKKRKTTDPQNNTTPTRNGTPPPPWPPQSRRSPTPPCPSPPTIQGAPWQSAQSRRRCHSGGSTGHLVAALFPLPSGPPNRRRPCRRHLGGALALLETSGATEKTAKQEREITSSRVPQGKERNKTRPRRGTKDGKRKHRTAALKRIQSYVTRIHFFNAFLRHEDTPIAPRKQKHQGKLALSPLLSNRVCSSSRH